MEIPPIKQSFSFELQELFDSDQADRVSLQSGEPNSESWNAIAANDAISIPKKRLQRR